MHRALLSNFRPINSESVRKTATTIKAMSDTERAEFALHLEKHMQTNRRILAAGSFVSFVAFCGFASLEPAVGIVFGASMEVTYIIGFISEKARIKMLDMMLLASCDKHR